MMRDANNYRWHIQIHWIDRNSYKILFNPSYHLKDIDFTSCIIFWNFEEAGILEKQVN
jgi:hypothetical protein